MSQPIAKTVATESPVTRIGEPEMPITLTRSFVTALFVTVAASMTSAGIISDDFNTGGPAPQLGWTEIDNGLNDPIDANSSRPGHLRIGLSAGTIQTIWTGVNTAPQLVTDTDTLPGTYRIETFVDTNGLVPNGGGGAMGGIILLDDANAASAPAEAYLSFGSINGTRMLWLQSPGTNHQSISTIASDTLHLRLDRTATGLDAFYKINVGDAWTLHDSILDSALPGGNVAGDLSVGLFAKSFNNQYDGPESFDFDYFNILNIDGSEIGGGSEIPAPAALPVGLAMLGVVAARRRRK